MTHIIFTAEEKNDLAGKYGKYAELNPVELKTGEFAVGIEVLQDENFLEIKSELEKLPQRKVKAIEFAGYTDI